MKGSRYKSKELAERVGITTVQLAHWVNIGAIEPLINDRRRGGVRYFDGMNMFEAMICKQINEYRLSIQMAKDALDFLKESPMFEQVFSGFEKLMSDTKKYPGEADSEEIGGYFLDNSVYLAIIPIEGPANIKKGSQIFKEFKYDFKEGGGYLYSAFPAKFSTVISPFNSAILINLSIMFIKSINPFPDRELFDVWRGRPHPDLKPI